MKMATKSQGLIGCYRAGRMMAQARDIRESTRIVDYYMRGMKMAREQGIDETTCRKAYKKGMSNEQ
jgi:hypothetical protein